MRPDAEEEWVGCGLCSAPFRTRAELIHHIENIHMEELPGSTLRNVSRMDITRMQRELRSTTQDGWTEHMFLDKNVVRCKGTVGRPYYQSILNSLKKVQKLCPATSIVSEPHDGRYKLQIFPRHVGHTSVSPPVEVQTTTWRVEADVRQEIRSVLKWIGQNTCRMDDDAIKEVYEKVNSLKHMMENILSNTNPSKDTLKRKIEAIQPDDVEKAVDEALEKYIQATKPILDSYSDIPKIVNTFSLKQEDDLNDFVNDVEKVMSNGDDLEKKYKKKAKYDGDSKMNPYVRLDQSQSFNDSYKSFIEHDLKTPLPAALSPNLLQKVVDEEINASLEKKHVNSIKQYRTARDLKCKKLKKDKIELDSSMFMNSGFAEDVTDTFKIKKETSPDDLLVKTHSKKAPLYHIDRNETIKTDTKKSKMSKKMHHIKHTTNKIGAEKQQRRQSNEIAKHGLKTPIVQLINTPLEENKKSKIAKKNAKQNKRVKTNVKADVKESLINQELSKILSLESPIDNHFNRKSSSESPIKQRLHKKLLSESPKKQHSHKKLSSESPKMQHLHKKLSSPSRLSKTPKIRLLCKPKAKRIHVKNKSKATETKSKTGLKSKPINAPKRKKAISDSLKIINSSKEQFVVKEQENDCNILIIRM